MSITISKTCHQQPTHSVGSRQPPHRLTKKLKPYAELIRLHKPAGLILCYFPCLYGTLLVGALGRCEDSTLMLLTNLKLLVLCFFLRNTFVTLNDIVDQDIDRQVERTRNRPLARGAISTRGASIFMVSQILLLLLSFYALPKDCLIYAVPFLTLHTLYPFAKHITSHPQLVLGAANSMGIGLSFPALSQKLSFASDSRTNLTAAAYLTLSTVIWTVTFDTIYAAQDLKDDKKIGIGSTMVYWGASTRSILRALAGLQILTLGAITMLIREQAQSSGVLCSVFTCAGTALGLGLMIERVDLDDPSSCGWWFGKGNILVGLAMCSGIACEYAISVM